MNKKINTRNGLLRKLIGSAWGAEPHAFRVTALAFYFSTEDFTSPLGEGLNTQKR